MVAAVMAVIVVGLLAAVIFRQAVHSSDASSFSRNQTQAVHAAEAGIDVAAKGIETSSAGELLCSYSETLETSPSSDYEVTIVYYDDYPVASASEIACDVAGHPVAEPRGAVITALGRAGGTGLPSVNRTFQTEVQLTPNPGFVNAIQAANSLTTTNNLTVNSSTGSGNIYLDGPAGNTWNCGNTVNIQGSVITQMNANLLNSCNITGNLWTRGSISMANSAHVGGDATSSLSTITMANTSRTDQNARSGGACSGCTTGVGGRVGGTVTANSPQAAPPTQAFPQLVWDQAQWEAAGYTVVTYPASSSTACTQAVSDAVAGYPSYPANTKIVARVMKSDCTLTFSGTSVPLDASLVFFTNGPIELRLNNSWTSTTSPTPTLSFIVNYTATCTGPLSDAGIAYYDPSIRTGNNTTFTGVHVFYYTPCTLLLRNSSQGEGGQFLAKDVVIRNSFTFSFEPLEIPGGIAQSFQVDFAYKRQVPTRS